MEQPIGPKVPPTHAAGFDPASVPGLLPPRRPADAAPAPEAVADEIEDAPEPEAADSGTAKSLAAPAAAESDDDASPADAAEDADADADAVEDAAEDDGKPVFEVSDRRGAIAADRTGVTFRLDGEVAEFGWDEIQAVEIDTPRFGRRFSVTVYTSTRRWFQSDVEAPSRGELKSWAAQLDEVLDARFEEGGEPEAPAEAVVPAQADDTEQVAETAEDAVEDADADSDATAKGAQANA